MPGRFSSAIAVPNSTDPGSASRKAADLDFDFEMRDWMQLAQPSEISKIGPTYRLAPELQSYLDERRTAFQPNGRKIAHIVGGSAIKAIGSCGAERARSEQTMTHRVNGNRVRQILMLAMACILILSFATITTATDFRGVIKVDVRTVPAKTKSITPLGDGQLRVKLNLSNKPGGKKDKVKISFNNPGTHEDKLHFQDRKVEYLGIFENSPTTYIGHIRGRGVIGKSPARYQISITDEGDVRVWFRRFGKTKNRANYFFRGFVKDFTKNMGTGKSSGGKDKKSDDKSKGNDKNHRNVIDIKVSGGKINY